MTINNPVSGSFRDPCGFVFEKDGVIYRQVNYIYKQHYDLLIKSGLYKELVNEEGCIETFPHRHNIDGAFAARLVKQS